MWRLWRCEQPSAVGVVPVIGAEYCNKIAAHRRLAERRWVTAQVSTEYAVALGSKREPALVSVLE